MSETIEAKALQLVSIFGDNYRFEIPEYQRPYAWTTEQTGELLDDLLHAMGDVESVSEASPYFLGSIVIIKSGSDPLAQIVDGQQRITTLTILFCVLRELASVNNKRTLHDYIYAPDDMFAGIKGHHRLTVRKLDRDFFENNIQQIGRLSDFVARSHAGLSDSRQRILQNARYLLKALTGLDEKQRNTLMQFLLQRCYLVVVATSNQNSAYRIFSVLNDRGLDLSPTDILKADIIGSLEENIRARYTAIWENIEESLGRDRFRDLFTHIRMIAMRNRSRGTLQQEFQDHVLKEGDRADFIDKVLEPYAEAYATVTSASYETTDGSEEVNKYLRYLNQLNNFDWIPPAMAFYKRNQNPEAFLHFIRDLERLAYAMFILRAYVNRRTSRYADVLRAIHHQKDLYGLSSPLQLSSKEISDVLSALDGPIYSRSRVPRTLLLRLDSLLADEGARYEHSRITIEHVLPRNPARNSQWLSDFPDEEEREEWTDRLANLVLLSCTKNIRALNYDFVRKKKEYFQRGGVATFALTTHVLAENEWTPAVLQRRQRELIDALKKEWRLDGAPPSPLVHTLKEQNKPTYNVEEVQGERPRAYDQTRQPLQKSLTSSEEADRAALDFDRGLFKKLRDLRHSLASERRVPSYMIFHDKTLQQMAYYFPQSRESFSRISGVGRVKLEELGEEFIAVIGNYARQHGLVERSIPVARRSRRQRAIGEGSTYEKTRQLLEQGLSIEQVAQARGRTKSTMIKHLELLVESDLDTDIRSLLAPDRFEEIRRAFGEADSTLFAPVKELLGDEYSYDEIRMVWIALRREGELPD